MRATSVVLTSLLCVAAAGAVQSFLILSRGVVADDASAVDDSLPDGDDEGRISLEGKLLVAAPGLDDPYFAGSVIYMLADDEQGALGVVLNRARGTVHGIDLWDGGPVGRDRVFVLHDDLDSDASIVVNGIAVAADPSVLDDVIDGKGPLRSRIFVGYAGWGPGQLDGELQEGAWLVADADPMMVLSDDVGVTTAKAYARAQRP